jgi:hypothetical protein
VSTTNVRRIGTAKKNLFERHAKLKAEILSLPVPEKLRLAADFLDRAGESSRFAGDALAVAKRAVWEIEEAMRRAELEIATEDRERPKP